MAAAVLGSVDKWEAVAAELADLPPGRRVLECGPGAGLYTLAMLRRGLRVTAVDVSGDAIDRVRGAAAAAGLAASLETVHGDFTRVASGMSGFDAVTFFKTLHHFEDLAAIAAALRSGYSALAPGGRIVGLEPNGACPLWKPWLLTLGRRQAHGVAASKWEQEKNLRLIKSSNLGAIFASLPGADWQVRFHYAVPAALLLRLPAFVARIDAWLLATRWRSLAFNLSFRVIRPA